MNQRHECGYDMLSPGLQERAGSSRSTYSWPIDDESGPSLLNQVLRPAMLTIRTSRPTNPRVDAAMNKNNPTRRGVGTPPLNVHRMFVGHKKLRKWDHGNHR